MTLTFTAEVFFWKGPAPWYFLAIPEELSREIKAIERLSTYGWGMIPVNATIGNTRWYTALWPKDGCYILPLKVPVRKAEKIEEGDTVRAQIEVILAQ